MDNMKLNISKNEMNLIECPIGLFVVKDTGILCVKTEYSNDRGGVDAYIAKSGERLSCGGKTRYYYGCEHVIVNPVTIEM